MLPDRSAAATANWLRGRPEVEKSSVEIGAVSFAQGAREGAPQARPGRRPISSPAEFPTGDRGEAIEPGHGAIDRSPVGGGGIQRRTKMARPVFVAIKRQSPAGHRASSISFVNAPLGVRGRNTSIKSATFTNEGMTLREVVPRRTGFHWRSIRQIVVRLSAPAGRRPRSRQSRALQTIFWIYLRRRYGRPWGCIVGRHLFDEDQNAEATSGSFSNLERLLAKWRCTTADAPATVVPMVQAVDPTTGWLISPIVAAALCIKPRASLNPEQAAKIEALKSASADFVVMRRLAMRLRGLFRSKSDAKLDAWLDDAHRSGLYAMQCFVRTLRQDIDAVRNALTECWSNGQTEGQINRLKTLKRAMYGRAGAELIRARMLPAPLHFQHAL